MKVMIQGLKNGDYVKVWDNVTAVTYRSDGRPEIHRRGGSSFVIEPDAYKIISIT